MTPRTPGKTYRGTNGNLHNMIYLSFICHLIIVTLIFIAIPTTSRRFTFGPVYSVQLVGSDAAITHQSTSLLKDISPLPQTSDAVMIKTKLSSMDPSPLRPQDADRLRVESAISALRQRDQSRSAHQDPVTAAGTMKKTDAEVNAYANEYIGVIWSRVKQHWSMPQSLLPANNITAIIDVKISRTGALEYAIFEKRSGNRYFDESALRAVQKASPFPPLPYWVRDDSIEIGIRFHSTELR
jgi:TonB family protein